MVFHLALSDSKSLQVSRNLLTILAVFNIAVFGWSPLGYQLPKSPRPFINPLVTVPKAPIPIGIIVTFTFHSFFNCRGRGTYLSFYILSVLFCGQPGQQCWHFCRFSFFFLLVIIRSGLQAEIRWSVYMSKSQRSLCVSFSWTGVWLGMYRLLAWSNLKFLYISQWITLPTQSCLALYSTSVNLLHSLIMWSILSSLSLHSLHLLFCCVLSILALIWLVFTALSCAAFWRDSVSLLKFSFLSHMQVLSSEILFISRLKRPWSCFPSHFCFLVFFLFCYLSCCQ